MLTHINIRDFAIVDELDLELTGGLTVLTGETGAGKSILIDALGLVLGDRADSSVVRYGCDRTEITVSFDVEQNPAISAWLQERELDMDNECILRRTITKEGRSRGYINGQPIPIQSLREVGEMMVDIHGQHEHQSLFKSHVQRETLDNYGQHAKLLAEVGQVYRQWQKLRKEFDTLSKAKEERDAKLDLLRFQVQELSALDVSEEELPELDAEHARLANASRLMETCERALQEIDENEHAALSRRLNQLTADLSQLQQVDHQLAPAVELLTNASIQLEEALTELRHYRDNLDLDPARLNWVEQRMASVHEMARKHHVTPDALAAMFPRMQAELAALEQADVRLEHIQKEIHQAENAYREAAAKLSVQRKKTAQKLSKLITANMQELGMQGGIFAVQVEQLTEDKSTAHGMDRIEFMVSANPGQPLKPLTKVASGGELSRISLAIQVITAQRGGIPTLIFDEVDTGVGGAVAEMVGHQLRALGQNRQVLCVTHLPQVAALGHQHLLVNKQATDKETRTRIQPLNADSRIDEIARMLGGLKMTEQTLSHAREMVERAGTVN